MRVWGYSPALAACGGGQPEPPPSRGAQGPDEINRLISRYAQLVLQVGPHWLGADGNVHETAVPVFAVAHHHLASERYHYSVDAGMPADAAFIPFAYAEAAANLLTNPALDPFGKIPEFKYCAVRVSALQPA